MAKGKIVRRGRNTLDLSLNHYNSPKGRTYDGIVSIADGLPTISSQAVPTTTSGLVGTPKAVSAASTAGSAAATGAGSIIGKANPYIAGATATIDFAKAAIGNAKSRDREDIKHYLDTIYGYNPNYSDYDSLLGGFQTFNFANDTYGKKDFMQSTGDYLKRTGEASLSGTVAGAEIGTAAGGGWGTAIGAAAGLLTGLASGIGGWIKSGSDAKKKAAKMNEYREEANTRARDSFKNNAGNIGQEQLYAMLRNYAAYGGPLSTHGADFDNGLKMIDVGGSHEESPLDGVPMGIAPDGVPNLVEEGEVLYNNYVFSNRLSPSKKLLTALHLPKKYENHTYAYIAEKLGKESEERPNDPISKAGLQDSMMRLMTAQETTRQIMKKNRGHKYAGGGWTEYLRYAPVVESGITALTDAFGWTNKPDYRNAETIEDAANSIREISAPQLSDYLTYNPFDREYFSNQLRAQGAATRRGVRNLAGLNRGTAASTLLAADYNNSLGLGNLFRQGLEYNQAQKEKVAAFNRGTHQFNIESILNAGKANQNRDADVAKFLTTAAQLRESIYGTTQRNKSQNLDNLATNLGSVGKEEYIKRMIENNPALLYDYLGRYKGSSKARGGYLTIKPKRR